MQCYSLTKRIKQDFPEAEVEVVDYNLPVIEDLYTVSLKKYYANTSLLGKAKKTLDWMKNPFIFKKLRARKRAFEAVLPILPITKERIVDNGMEKVTNLINSKYDIVVVGSDAVWNYYYRKFPNIYFPDESVKAKKLSYAASCYGMDYLKEEKNRERIGQILDGFSFIGVRDGATENFVGWSGSSLAPSHTCDPTAFLDVDDLPIDIAVLEKKLAHRGFNFKKPAIGVMGSQKMLDMVRKAYGKRYQIVSLYEPVRGADVQLYDISPYEWAYVFKYFKLTFTTYFHGTMLSLRNGVPVICIALKTEFAKKHTPKTLDVLTRIGCQDWYFTTDYKTENTLDIIKTADRLLKEDLTEEIKKKMDVEAQSYNAFKAALESTIKTIKETTND